MGNALRTPLGRLRFCAVVLLFVYDPLIIYRLRLPKISLELPIRGTVQGLDGLKIELFSVRRGGKCF
jgi:hypothetical protein